MRSRPSLPLPYLPVVIGAIVGGLLLVGCGSKEPKAFGLEATKTCMTAKGVTVGGDLDFVASTATAGAFVGTVPDGNSATFSFGTAAKDGRQMVDAYERFAFENVRAGLPDVLKLNRNVASLWKTHPSDTDLNIFTSCLT